MTAFWTIVQVDNNLVSQSEYLQFSMVLAMSPPSSSPSAPHAPRSDLSASGFRNPSSIASSHGISISNTGIFTSGQGLSMTNCSQRQLLGQENRTHRTLLERPNLTPRHVLQRGPSVRARRLESLLWQSVLSARPLPVPSSLLSTDLIVKRRDASPNIA